ncbi:MAG: aminotransferase class V-fold PLP-dependent enzyme, partial [Pseudomonadota bacterium]
QAAADSLPESSARLAALRDRLEGGLFREVPGLLVNGHPENRLPNTANLSFPGVSGAEVLTLSAGVSASTGAACHGPDLRVSHVLAAMGINGERAVGTVRLSVGRFTTEDEVGQAAALLTEAWRSLRQ